MIRLFAMFLVCFNANLAKLVIYFVSQKYSAAGHRRCTRTCKTRKVVTHSSGLQKLENSNLKILKFEARFAYAVKFLMDFFD